MTQEIDSNEESQNNSVRSTKEQKIHKRCDDNSREEAVVCNGSTSSSHQIEAMEEPCIYRKKILDAVLDIERNSRPVYILLRDRPEYEIIAECLRRDVSLLQVSEIPHIDYVNYTKLAASVNVVVRKAMAMLLDKSLETSHNDIRQMYESAVFAAAQLTKASKVEIREQNYATSRVISQLLELNKYLMFVQKNFASDIRFFHLQVLIEACIANLEKNGIGSASCSEVYSALTVAADVAQGINGTHHASYIRLQHCAKDILELLKSNSAANSSTDNEHDNKSTTTLDHWSTNSASSTISPSQEAITPEAKRVENLSNNSESPLQYSATDPDRGNLKLLKPNADYINSLGKDSTLEHLVGTLHILANTNDPIVYAPPFDHYFPHLGKAHCLMSACPDNWQTLRLAHNALVLANALFSGDNYSEIKKSYLYSNLHRSLETGKSVSSFVHIVRSVVRSCIFRSSIHAFGDNNSTNSCGYAVSPASGTQFQNLPDNIYPSGYRLLELQTPANLPLPQDIRKLDRYIALAKLTFECILKTGEHRQGTLGKIPDLERNLLTDVGRAKLAIESAAAEVYTSENNDNKKAQYVVQEMLVALQAIVEEKIKNSSKDLKINVRSLILNYRHKFNSLRHVSRIVTHQIVKIFSIVDGAFCTKPVTGETTEQHRASAINAPEALSNKRASTVTPQPTSPMSVTSALKKCDKLVEQLQNFIDIQHPKKSAKKITENLSQAFSYVAHARALCADADAYSTPLKSASSSILGAITALSGFVPSSSATTSRKLLDSLERCIKILKASLQAALTEATNSGETSLLLKAKKNVATALNAAKYVDANSEIIKEYSTAKIAENAFVYCMKDLSGAVKFHVYAGTASVHDRQVACALNIHLKTALASNNAIINLLKQYSALRSNKPNGFTEEDFILYDVSDQDVLLFNLYESLHNIQCTSGYFSESSPPQFADISKNLRHLIHKHVFAGMAFTDPVESAKDIDTVCKGTTGLIELVNESQLDITFKAKAKDSIEQACILLKRASYGLKRTGYNPQALYSEDYRITVFPSESSLSTAHEKHSNNALPSLSQSVQSIKVSWYKKITDFFVRLFFPRALSEERFSSTIKSLTKNIETLLGEMKQYSSQSTSKQAQLWKNLDDFCQKSVELAELALKSQIHADVLNAECHFVGSLITVNTLKKLSPISEIKEQKQKLTQLGKEIVRIQKKLRAYAEGRKNACLCAEDNTLRTNTHQHTDLYISWDTLGAAWWQNNKGLTGLKQAIKKIRRIYGSRVKVKAHASFLGVLFEYQDWESIDFICNNCVVCDANGDAGLKEIIDLFRQNLRNESNKETGCTTSVSTKDWRAQIRNIFKKMGNERSRDDVPLFLKAFVENSCAKAPHVNSDLYCLPKCDLDPILSSLCEIPEQHDIASFLLYKCIGGKISQAIISKCQSYPTIRSFDNISTVHHSSVNPESKMETDNHESVQSPPNNALVSHAEKHLLATELNGFSLVDADAYVQQTKDKDTKSSSARTETSSANSSGKTAANIVPYEDVVATPRHNSHLETGAVAPVQSQTLSTSKSTEETTQTNNNTISPESYNSSRHILFDEKGNVIEPEEANTTVSDVQYIGTLSEIANPHSPERPYRKTLNIKSYRHGTKKQGFPVGSMTGGVFGSFNESESSEDIDEQDVRDYSMEYTANSSTLSRSYSSSTTDPSETLTKNDGRVTETQDLPPQTSFSSEYISKGYDTGADRSDMDARQL